MPALDFRKSLIAKIHVAKKQLAMREDDYRALLNRVTGKDSSAALSEGQLKAVVKEMESIGFKAIPARKAGPKPADSQEARKIRAMWITLHQMGEVSDPSETALSAFVKRQTGIDNMAWLNHKDTSKVMNALRSWTRRAKGEPDA